MTLNFYVSYLVPVSPKKIQEIQQQIAVTESMMGECTTPDSRRDAELHLNRLRAQMEPERRRESAIMRSHVGPDDGRITDWYCPRCGYDRLTNAIASAYNNEISMRSSCVGCGAEVHKEELPMSLDLYRMRTRRTDGVEIQPEREHDVDGCDDPACLACDGLATMSD